MKKYIFIAGVAALLGLSSCSKSYLDTEPQSSVSTPSTVESIANAEHAINGLCKIMTTPYISQGFNGEGTIKTYYGNYPGNDFQKCAYTGFSNVINGTYHTTKTSTYLYYPWFYYYKLIGNANVIIANIDNAEGTEKERAFIKAQALTFRAYAFSQLVQLYGYRWSDSNNGATDGIVLRLDESHGDIALSTLGESYKQIYADLDEAIALYQKSGMDRNKKEFYKPNLNVAYAIYARAALNREDWANAAKYAALARTGITLMTNDQYADGMHTANSEWIWGVYEAEDQSLGYFGFYAYQGSNSSSSVCRTYPCAISRELIDQIPETDVRRNLYLIPTAAELKECNSAGRSTKTLYKRAFKEYGDRLYETSYVYVYMQFKFLAAFMPGGGSFSLIRGAEMYYVEAEADCHLGKDAEAQQLLFDANKDRDAALVKSEKTGDELLDEVRLYRRFDLWGEGFDWFDYKRWGLPISRKALSKGGSFHTTFAKTIQPEAENQWTWMLPNKETDYNGLIE